IALLGAILTARLKTSLTTSLTGLGLPDAVRQKVVFDFSHGGPGAGGARSIPGVDPAALQTAFHAAFVSGMRLSLLVASIALFAGSVVAFTFVRGRPARQPAATGRAGEAEA